MAQPVGIIPNPLEQPYFGPLPNPLYPLQRYDQVQGIKKRDRIKRWKSINSGTLTTEECAQLWVDAGGKPEDAPMAAAITRPESGGRVDIVNSIGATGLWQIHPGGPQYKNAWNNARAAVAKRRAKPNTWGPNPWAVCHDGACSNLAGEAAKIGKPDNGGILPDIPNPLTDPLGGLDAIASAIRNIGEAMLGILKIFTEILTKIADPNTWLDALKIGAGIALVFMGLKRLLTVTT